MNASLRIQFLVPMWIAVVAIAGIITFFSKWSADRASHALALERLSRTGKLCFDAKYPLTPSVLTQIQDLSGSRLAIVSIDLEQHNESDLRIVRDANANVRFENASAGFPMNLEPSCWQSLVRHRFAQSQTTLERWTSADGQAWNALAMPITQNKDISNSDRLLVLLETTAVEDRSSVQSFLLPMISGICSLIAIAFVATFVASRIGTRIERLKQHVSKIANGSFESIAPSGPKDAIYSLYESVNLMSQQLRESTTQIAHHERSRLVNLIASGLAHELRNQLTGARLAIQTCQTEAESQEAQEALQIALKQMQLAEESIQRLLSMRSGSSPTASHPLSIADINRTVFDLTGPMAKHQSVDLQFVADHSLSDQGDATLIVEDGNAVVGALINLILNAIEATGPSGKVEVRFRSENDNDLGNAEWQIADDGPGPSEAIATKMFEPFATTKREGVGLGLAVCKQVASRLGGTLHWVRERNRTVFILRIRTRSQGTGS